MLRDPSQNPITPHGIGSFRYETDYFNGSNVFIMVNDILIDSAISIDFAVQQSKTPVYGYAQQYYSFVADGHVFVQGTLNVAFKEAAYMLHPLKRFANSNITGLAFSTSPRYEIDENGKFVNNYQPQDYTFAEASRIARKRKNITGNVEQYADFLNNAATDETYTDQMSKKAYSQQLYKELQALSDNDFEDWAEAFEDVVWYGAERTNPFVRDKLYSKNLVLGNEITDEDVYGHRRIDQYPEVDLSIIYGDVAIHSTNHTIQKILDVSFLGTAKTIEISGQPIYDSYSFIARTAV